MEEFGAVLWIWLVHAGVASVLSAPIVFFGRKQVHWHAWEALVLILPFLCWCLFMFSDLATGRKNLANLGEPFFFALAIPFGALIRVAVGKRVPESPCALGLIALVCAVAAGVFFVTPPLPE